MRTFKIYSFSNFQMYSTVSLTIVSPPELPLLKSHIFHLLYFFLNSLDVISVPFVISGHMTDSYILALRSLKASLQAKHLTPYVSYRAFCGLHPVLMIISLFPSSCSTLCIPDTLSFCIFSFFYGIPVPGMYPVPFFTTWWTPFCHSDLRLQTSPFLYSILYSSIKMSTSSFMFTLYPVLSSILAL